MDLDLLLLEKGGNPICRSVCNLAEDNSMKPSWVPMSPMGVLLMGALCPLLFYLVHQCFLHWSLCCSRGRQEGGIALAWLWRSITEQLEVKGGWSCRGKRARWDCAYSKAETPPLASPGWHSAAARLSHLPELLSRKTFGSAVSQLLLAWQLQQKHWVN